MSGPRPWRWPPDPLATTPWRRLGGTLLEALLSLLLGVVVVALVLGLLTRTRDAARRLTLRSDRLTAVRVARTLLERDGPGAEPTGPLADSVGVRAYRGTARSCGVPADSTSWWVEVAGVRRPDPAKDSVAVLGRDGRWSLHALEARAPATGCGGLLAGGRGERWRLSPPPRDPLLGRYFERGSYHLSGDALRYRRGRGGRQPLTPAVLATPASRFEWDRNGVRARIRFELDGEGGATPPEWVVPLPLGGGAGDG